MRWLAPIVLAACQFVPRAAATDAPPGAVTDAARDATTSLDAPEATDAPRSPDAPASTGFVRMIDLTDAQIAGGPHADFPLLVAITASWLRDTGDGGEVARADGFDIYFSADQAGAQRLSHEVEQYAPDTGALTAWVRIPSLTPQTVLYLHYGDPSITTSQQDVAAVWSGGYQLVVHLAGQVDATGKTTSFQSSNLGEATGKIGTASTFDGSSSRISVGAVTAIDDVFATGGTAEGWFDAASYGQASYGRLFDKKGDRGWGLYVANVGGFGSQALAFRHGASGGSLGSWFTPDQSVSLNAWHHAAVVYDQRSASNAPVLYIDGVPQALDQVDFPTGPMASDAGADLYIGDRATLDRAFDGMLDEMRLSAVPRSAAWIATEYRNQSDPAGFYAVSAPL